MPKMENHLEARLWNGIFVLAQKELGVAQGTIKATVLLETILATFEMEEILYELREHSAGLNAGRWDYIFSAIKKFKNKPGFCLANRVAINMEVPFMRSYALALVQACHKRGAPAIGGMAALIPIKGDAAANEKALAGVRHDKKRDANDGFDGGWIAHPGLVQIAMEEFTAVLGDKPNQWGKQRDEKFAAANFLNFVPEAPITEAGLRNNINVGIHYLRGDFALAGLAVGDQRQGRARRRPQGRRGFRARADSRGTRQGQGDGHRAGRERRHLRPGLENLRGDGVVEELSRVPDAASLRSDGIKPTTPMLRTCMGVLNSTTAKFRPAALDRLGTLSPHPIRIPESLQERCGDTRLDLDVRKRAPNPLENLIPSTQNSQPL